jgi:hypothetical protein
MLKYYGSEINGLVTSINQFIVYISLVEAGLSAAAVYALYKPLASNDFGKVNAVVSAAKQFYTKSGYIFISITIGLAAFAPVFLKPGSISPLYVGLLVLILGVNGALEFFTLAKYRVLLTADQKTHVISLATIVYLLVNTGVIVVLGSLKTDIVVLRLVALASIFLRSFILMGYVKLHYKFLNYKAQPDLAALKTRWDAFYLQILGAVQSGAPVIILTVVTADLKLVSVFVVFNMVIAGISGVLSIFMTGLAASFGEVIAKRETAVLRRAYGEFEFAYYGLIAVSYAVALVLLMPFVRLYTAGVTDAVYDVPLLGALTVANGLLYNLKTPQGMLVQSAGLFKETRVQTTIQCLIALTLGVVLTPFLGIAGVLLGMIASNLYRTIDLNWFVHRHITSLGMGPSFWRMGRVLLMMALAAGPFAWIQVAPSGYLGLAGWGVAASVWAVIMAALVGAV